jgi:enoyl-CoA hydratase/carnithine racemase
MRGGRARPAVRTRVADGVAWITLARGATGNRLDAELTASLAAACAEIALDAAVHVVVLAAEGRSFSLGLPPRIAWPPAAWPDAVGAFAALPQPVIAVIDGAAEGWGLALALACDVRIASSRATFAVPDAGRGRLPGGGLTQRLPRIVGAARASALVLLGERLSARDAERWGLVAEVVVPGRLAARAAACARVLAARGPIALRYAKEAVLRALDQTIDDGVRLEHDLYVLLQTTADRGEGIDAFLARRPPRFHAR